MSQVITVSLGGGGINMGKEALELSAKEHGIDMDGYSINDN